MVLDATDQNFQTFLKENSKVVVKYYADWCGSCRLFKPKFKRMSEDVRFAEIKFLDINAEENPESRKMANVNNLPYFAIFKHGQFLEGFSTNKEEAVVELIQKL
ncbi:MAG: thioredoxin family protein [Flammeovirgaceae bacterium]